MRHSPTVIWVRAAFAAAMATLLLLSPGDAMRILGLLAALTPIAAAVWLWRKTPGKRRLHLRWSGLLLLIPSAFLLYYLVPPEPLAAAGVAFWACHSALRDLSAALDRKKHEWDRGFSLAEGITFFALGGFFLFSTNRLFFENAPFFALFFIGDALIGVAAAKKRG